MKFVQSWFNRLVNARGIKSADFPFLLLTLSSKDNRLPNEDVTRGIRITINYNWKVGMKTL